MRPTPLRLPSLVAATATAALLAVITVATQSGFFNEAFEGELFGVRDELTTPGYPAGVAFVNGTLYVADGENGTVIAYDTPGGRPIPLLDAVGLVPNQLTIVTVDIVTGTTTRTETAILVSDSTSNRVFAFDRTGARLFAMRLDWPDVSVPASSVQRINGMAMGPGARFTHTPATNTLSLTGKFAAAWAVDFGQGVPGALLVYKDNSAAYTAFEYDENNEQFIGTPYRSLTDGGRTNEAFGVSFDSAGNLYLADSFRYTITAYGASLNPTPLFTFGTPTVGGKTEEFYEPYGVAFWPNPADPAGGRLFIADAINHRIVAYRPNLTGGTLDPLFAIELPNPGALAAGQPYGVAVDPSSGKVATSDAWVPNRVWVFQTRNVVAFDLHLLDANDTRVEAVCSGAPYSVRFSLTVPAGRPPVLGATPHLTVAGAIINGTNVGPANLVALQTQTYTYSLTAPGTRRNPVVVNLPIFAAATAVSTTDVLPRAGIVPVMDCSGLPPTITATPTPSVMPRQLSGWTPVFPEDEPYGITFVAAAAAARGDSAGIEQIEYELLEANKLGQGIVTVGNSGTPPPAQQVVTVTLVEMGRTPIKFRARSTKSVWSAPAELIVWPQRVVNQMSIEGQVVDPFTVGPPHQAGLTYSAAGMPPGVSFEPASGRFSGSLGYNAAREHTVTMTESDGTTSTSWTFIWKVDNVNLPPVAMDDSYTIAEDTPLNTQLLVPARGVLANDTNEDAAPLTARLVSGPSSGVLAFNANGSFVYTPAANFNGSDAFTYQANDGAADSALATVAITVTAVNDAPVATADVRAATEDTAVTFLAAELIANDRDVEGSALTIASVTSGSGGTVVLNANGTVTFTPAANFSGVATFSYRATDGGLMSNAATVTVSVAAVNDAPIARNDTYSTGGNALLTVAAPGVLGNDTDVDGPPLSVSLVPGPTLGLVNLLSNGSFTYTPPAGFNGSDAFTYSVSDGALTAIGTVNISSNRAPDCTAASVTPSILWPPNHKPVYLTLRGITDPEDGTPTIRFTGIRQDEPTNGPGQGHTLQDGGIEAGGARAWVRAERSGGGDGRVYLISYTATDAALAFCTGQVRVHVPHDQRGAPAVLSPGEWNSRTGELVSAPPPPVAVADAVIVRMGEQKIIAVLSNDVANGQPLTVSIVSKPTKGSAKLNENGTITYKAPSNWTGTTSFTYRVSNSFGGTAMATVTITVTNSSHDDDDESRGDDDDDDCGDSRHDHSRDSDSRDRDHRRGDHDRCRHR